MHNRRLPINIYTRVRSIFIDLEECPDSWLLKTGEARQAQINRSKSIDIQLERLSKDIHGNTFTSDAARISVLNKLERYQNEVCETGDHSRLYPTLNRLIRDIKFRCNVSLA